jgi:hypothetical protein
LKAYFALDPTAQKNRCPTWIFLAAASSAFAGSTEVEAENLQLEDVVCVLASLIDQASLCPAVFCTPHALCYSEGTATANKIQSFILGHLSYSQQYLVMRPSEDGMGGFPKIAQVAPRRVEGIQ